MRAAVTSRFWITGLPRSRTAWFAVAMRAAGCRCFHELTAETGSFAELKARWTEGNSDSGCGLHVRRILAEIAPRTLVIERPVDDVAMSLVRLYGPRLGLCAHLEELRDALSLSHPLIKRVAFNDLKDREALIEAAEWLSPGSGEAVASLSEMNIQVTKAHAEALTVRPHTLWHLGRAA